MASSDSSTVSGPSDGMPSPVARIVRPFNYLLLRFVVVYAIAVCLILVAVSRSYETLIKLYAPAVAESAAAEFKGKRLTHAQIFECAARHNLAWCYVTKGESVTSFTQPFAPRLARYKNKSREISVDALKEGATAFGADSVVLNVVDPDADANLAAGRYFEEVAPMGNGEYFHAGFNLESPTLDQFIHGKLPDGRWYVMPDEITVMEVALGLITLAIPVIYLSVCLPLIKLRNALEEVADLMASGAGTDATAQTGHAVDARVGSGDASGQSGRRPSPQENILKIATAPDTVAEVRELAKNLERLIVGSAAEATSQKTES